MMLRTIRLAAGRVQAARGLHSAAVNRAKYNSILDTVGQTPVVKLNSIAPEHVTMYAKCEFMNPLSSVKDRLALGVIDWAEKEGLLKPGDTVVEATSGNTGIATAMVCAARGYKCIITMAESFSVERRKIMRMLGANVVLTPAPAKGSGMVAKAEELCETHGFFYVNQFVVQANPDTHEATTGTEILSDFEGERLDYWVTGYGTGGTFQGAGKAIKAARPDTKIVLSEPSGAALVTSGIPQQRKEVLGVYGAAAESHPEFKPHPIQGWTPDFIPNVLQDGLELGLHDDLLLVDPADGIAISKRLAAEEGIFTGISGGSTVATALEVAESAPEGSVILAMLPDTAERYLSTPLFQEITPEMNEAETALFNSTPLFTDN
mmetsp:Transcript_12738/g.38123  ORF Transcript_12738/g.38123 Transcript_12738/m.38123 type:complete len:377 (-) Transcript_12738:1966-3096(-)